MKNVLVLQMPSNAPRQPREDVVNYIEGHTSRLAGADYAIAVFPDGEAGIVKDRHGDLKLEVMGSREGRS